MNQELIRIALENKEIIEAYKSQIHKGINIENHKPSNITIGLIYKIILITGIGIIGYAIYYNYKKKMRD